MKCRHCDAELNLTLIDLGSAPPSNAYLTPERLRSPEQWYPLRVLVCVNCWLVQTEDFARADELFTAEYAYFSSYSRSWLDHAEHYVAEMVARFRLSSKSYVAEVAANDGYLLQFVRSRGIPCIGVEPTASTAAAARARGIDIVEAFFGTRLAQSLVEQCKQADLTTANNVLAHVPDINDFVSGFALLLKPEGVATFEFPHVLRLVDDTQFDTIYHEHFSYLSLTTVVRVFAANGLRVFDVEELPTHGGSLRVFAQRAGAVQHPRDGRVDDVLRRELLAGICSASFYEGFQAKAEKVKDDFLAFLLDAKRQCKSVAAYGAAAKGNTLLNFAGVRSDLIHFVVDQNPAKRNKFMPGSRIPILDESALRDARPDYVVILPWNLKDELMGKLSYVRDWGSRFVTAIPSLQTT
jgi:2-polyprenyl-3-methyl-5-hydroxy-6-metoxy-1,4-benzoquinol methylase